MSKIVKCKSFSMYRTSISMLFNKTPKIEYICGNCNFYNEGRISVSSVRKGYPYIKCELCGAINEIPIEMRRILKYRLMLKRMFKKTFSFLCKTQKEIYVELKKLMKCVKITK